MELNLILYVTLLRKERCHYLMSNHRYGISVNAKLFAIFSVYLQVFIYESPTQCFQNMTMQASIIIRYLTLPMKHTNLNTQKTYCTNKDKELGKIDLL